MIIVITKIFSLLIFSLKSEAHKITLLVAVLGIFCLPFFLTNLALCLRAHKTGMYYCWDVETLLPFSMTFQLGFLQDKAYICSTKTFFVYISRVHHGCLFFFLSFCHGNSFVFFVYFLQPCVISDCWWGIWSVTSQMMLGVGSPFVKSDY